MWVSIESESLRCFHVAPRWTEDNSTLNKASVSSPPATTLWNDWRTSESVCAHSARIAVHDTFSRSVSLSGFHGSPVSRCRISVIILATYLHVDSRGIDWGKEVGEVNPREHVVLTKPDWKHAGNPWSWQFYGRVGREIPDTSRFSPQRSGDQSGTRTGACPQNLTFIIGRCRNQTTSSFLRSPVSEGLRLWSQEKVDFSLVVWE